jgi:DNA invertase Pin-like site-specific DNA recombinase
MRKIGYARVSSATQNLDRQLGALRAERCDQIFAEKMSGKSLKGRPQLEKGWAPATCSWWPSGTARPRSMMDGIAIIDRVLARGALVKVLDKPHLDLTGTIGKGLLAFLSAIAQDERERIAKRAGEGRAAAKAAGKRFGRKPKLDEHQSAEARRRLADGESFRAIARSYRVSHTTISRLNDA